MAGGWLAALAAAGVVLGVGPGTGGEQAALCARLDPADGAVVAGEVGEAGLVETSGLAASRAHDGVLWAHNDSGDQPRVFALGEDGEALGAYAVEGAAHVDWEDMAVGPGPGGVSALYIGDIGQNIGPRDPVTVYRVPEPAAAPDGSGGTLAGVEALELTYPDGSADAEALLVDPLTGDLFIVTKVVDGSAAILHAAADDLVPGAPIAVDETGIVAVTDPGPVEGADLPGTLVTGGDVSRDGSIVVLRTYEEVLAYARPEGSTVGEALTGEPCATPVPDEPQGEAVAVTGAGDAIVTISELGPEPADVLPVHRIALAPVDEEPELPTATTTTTPAGADEASRAEDAEDDGDGIVVIAVVIAVVVVAVGTALVVRRRGAPPPG